MTKVFVHGNPETSVIWKPVVELLNDRRINDIVLLSPPGFGAPTPKDWGGTVREYTQWLADELKAIGCDTAKSVLEMSVEELVKRTDLEKETIEEVFKILNAEFE